MKKISKTAERARRRTSANGTNGKEKEEERAPIANDASPSASEDGTLLFFAL